jgi:hypothetical protein
VAFFTTVLWRCSLLLSNCTVCLCQKMALLTYAVLTCAVLTCAVLTCAVLTYADLCCC